MDRISRIAEKVAGVVARPGDVCEVDVGLAARILGMGPATRHQMRILRDVVRQGDGFVVVEKVSGDRAYVYSHENPAARMLGGVEVPLVALEKTGRSVQASARMTWWKSIGSWDEWTATGAKGHYMYGVIVPGHKPALHYWEGTFPGPRPTMTFRVDSLQEAKSRAEINEKRVAGSKEASDDWTSKMIRVVQSTYDVASALEGTPGLNARKAERIVSANFDLDDWGPIDWDKVAKVFRG